VKLKFQTVAEKTAKNFSGLLYFAAPGMWISGMWSVCVWSLWHSGLHSSTVVTFYSRVSFSPLLSCRWSVLPVPRIFFRKVPSHFFQFSLKISPVSSVNHIFKTGVMPGFLRLIACYIPVFCYFMNNYYLR